MKYINFKKYSFTMYFSRCKIEIYNKNLQLIFSYDFVSGQNFEETIEAFGKYIHYMIEDYVEERDDYFICGVYKVVLK